MERLLVNSLARALVVRSPFGSERLSGARVALPLSFLQVNPDTVWMHPSRQGGKTNIAAPFRR
jgi:hypothetical protein